MKVVVTGATGNVGTSVIRALAADERIDEIVGIARRRPAMQVARTRFVRADVVSDDLGHHFRGADAVVHLAWLFQPTHRPTVTWRANAIGSTRVFGAAAASGVRTLIHASSVGAYSPAPGRTVDESWPTHSLPTSAYGREKAYAERALDAIEAGHPAMRVVRMRPAFIFKRESATQQRRLFAGPLLPRFAARPGRLPVVPLPAGLRFQALHSDDAAEAYRLALLSDVRGAINLAAEPVIDTHTLGRILGRRTIEIPPALVRAPVAAAWWLHLLPTDPALLDLVLSIPLLDASRARDELGWTPRRSGVEALGEMLTGMAQGAGAATPPLARDTAQRRAREVATGIGERP